MISVVTAFRRSTESLYTLTLGASSMLDASALTVANQVPTADLPARSRAKQHCANARRASGVERV